MNSRSDEEPRTATPTSLYLVRLWRAKAGDGSTRLHGKLQHVVSGTSCHFDGLASLPGALEKMMEQELPSLGPIAGSLAGDRRNSYRDDQHQGG